MLSAIISDTILLKSKTTTNEDIDAFNYLTEFTGINSTKYGLEMLIAGTNVSDYSEYDIITVDSKAYTVNGYPIKLLMLTVQMFLKLPKEKQNYWKKLINI